MTDSKLKTVTKDEPCRHCDKPDWCYRLDDLEVCKRGMIADGWQATTKPDTEGSFYLRIAKTDRPWGQTFKHEYRYFDSDRTATQRRYYNPETKKKDCKWTENGVTQADLMPYKWELASSNNLIFIAEGEMQVDDLIDRGLLTTSCRLWADRQASLFTGKTVVLILDCDREGIEKFGKAAALLTKHGATVKYCYLPKIGNWQYPPKNGGLDSYDYFRLGGTVDELRDCITDHPLKFKSDQDEDDLSLDANHLAELTNYSKPENGLLPEAIERAITGLAEKMGLSPELYYADLLATAGSLIPIGTTLLIDSGTDYHCPPVFWIGTVAETGAMKSPKSKAILNPLIELQYTAEEIYKAELEIWQAQEKSEESTGKKPVGRDYYLSDFTLEYISQTIAKQPLQGFTLYMDELAAFFRGFDQYRNGKGSDRARFLSAYDGGAWKSNRKSDDTRVFAKRTGISIIGGIQPSVLQKIMTDDLSSEDGLWARFSWIRLPLTKAPSPSGGRYVIGDLLKGLYRDLGNLPEGTTYTLSKQAQQLWAIWHDEMEALKLTEASPILRAIYPKMKERAGRIALIAHCINHRGGLATEISVDTLQKAISFTRWLIAQSKELYAEFGIGDNPEMARILRFVNRFQNCGEINAVQVRAWWSTKKPKLQEIRDFMSKVVNLGYAIAKGDPTKSNYIVTVTRGSQFSQQQMEPLPDIALTVDCVPVNNSVKTVNNFSLDTDPVDCGDCQADCVPVNSQIQTEKDLQTPLTELTAYSKNGIENHDDFTDF